MKKRPLLARLRINGVTYLIGALLLLVGVPLYQSLILNPTGYGAALNALGAGQSGAYLGWIATHNPQFVIYRVLLIIPFALLFSLPFALFRIIVAQELMRQIDQREQRKLEAAENEEEGEQDEGEEGDDQETQEDEESGADGLPAYAWRGKGFVIIAAWAGLAGLVLYVLGAAVELSYLLIASSIFSVSNTIATNFSLLSSIFSIIVNTVGLPAGTLHTIFWSHDRT